MVVLLMWANLWLWSKAIKFQKCSSGSRVLCLTQIFKGRITIPRGIHKKEMQLDVITWAANALQKIKPAIPSSPRKVCFLPNCDWCVFFAEEQIQKNVTDLFFLAIDFHFEAFNQMHAKLQRNRIRSDAIRTGTTSIIQRYLQLLSGILRTLARGSTDHVCSTLTTIILWTYSCLHQSPSWCKSSILLLLVSAVIWHHSPERRRDERCWWQCRYLEWLLAGGRFQWYVFFTVTCLQFFAKTNTKLRTVTMSYGNLFIEWIASEGRSASLRNFLSHRCIVCVLCWTGCSSKNYATCRLLVESSMFLRTLWFCKLEQEWLRAVGLLFD